MANHVGRHTAAGAVQARLERLTIALAIIQAVCVAAFLIDLAVEFPDPGAWLMLSPREMVHLLSESLIVVLMLVGFAMARRAYRVVAKRRDVLEEDLHALRKDFDRILQDRLDAWHLTSAQRDVALLCLRGLRISEIARLRGSAEGTVKAHMSAIFRAAGVRTRGELIALFMDEFMDHGAATTDRSPAHPAAGS